MCGFKDIRKDAQGYYCSVCDKRMDEGYERRVTVAGYGQQLREIVSTQPGTNTTGDGNVSRS